MQTTESYKSLKVSSFCKLFLTVIKNNTAPVFIVFLKTINTISNLK